MKIVALTTALIVAVLLFLPTQTIAQSYGPAGKARDAERAAALARQQAHDAERTAIMKAALTRQQSAGKPRRPFDPEQVALPPRVGDG